MGNPHAVVYLDDVDNLDIEKIGPALETSRVPRPCKHGICQSHRPENSKNASMGTRLRRDSGLWYRRPCVIAVSSILNNLTGEEVTVKLLGGDLKIHWDRLENLVYMTGPATTVFDGEITLP